MNRSLQLLSNSPPADPAKIGGDRQHRRLALIGLLVLILLSAACLATALFWQLFNPPQASGFLGVSLLSKKAADYHADPRSLSFPPQEASIIQDILQDKDPYATDLPVRIATLESVLEQPISTATPLWQGLPTGTATAMLPPAASSTSSPAATLAGSGTVTPTPSATSTSISTKTLTTTLTPTTTLTLKASLTATPTCGATTSATNHCTPTPTGTAKASPTSTGTPNAAVTVPATPTPTRTSTARPTPTPTATKALPPTNTPTSTPTATKALPPTQTPTSTVTKTLPPTNTPTSTATATATEPPVILPTDTDTPVPTSTDTPVPVVVPTLTTCNAIPANSLRAVADSYVDRTRADVNFGSDPNLYVRPSAGVDKRSLVRFDLGFLAGKNVQAAILYVTNAKGDNYAVSVLKVTAPWDEMGVTWNNQPAADTGSAAGSFQLTNDLCTRGTLLNTGLVQGWVDDPGSNFGVMLYPPAGAGDVNFSSREGPNPPQLFVVYQ